MTPFFIPPAFAVAPAFEVIVAGHAIAAGSGRPVPIRKREGDDLVTVGSRVADDSRNLRGWKQLVRDTAIAAGANPDHQLLHGPVAVEMRFVRTRPRTHFGTGRNTGQMKNSAPAFPTTRPDVLKLARGVEDALTGVVWHDDSQIIDERIVKAYGNYAAREECRVRVWELPQLHTEALEAERMRNQLDERFDRDGVVST